MDSQTATLYDTASISKCGLTELSFNAVNKPKVPEKCQKTGSSASTHSKRFVIVPSSSNLEKLSPSVGPSLLTSPVMSPSPSFCKPKHHHHGSMRSVRSGLPNDHHITFSSPNMMMAPHLSHLPRAGSYIFSESGSTRMFSDASSVRSLASIGMGSTDGRRMVIRKVPHSPSELMNYICPPTPPEELYENDSYDQSDDLDIDNLKPRRQHWSSKMQFVLACIGYSVGLSNVWRFPYMCYKSGGGVFLIPYFIILCVCGIPMLFMELSVGQFSGRGPIGALGQLSPLFKGVGLASVIVSFLMSTYYSVIIAYSIYYFFTSFRPDLPWAECKNPRWTTPDCWTMEKLKQNLTRPFTPQTPAEEFFENKVLQMTSGIQFPGGMRWDLVACLVCAWILVYFAIWKSIKSSTKIRYFTASFPFVLIVVFLGRALTLEGAEKGLQYFFRPNWSELGNANIWINAGGQVFNSLGISFGSMIAFASYNKYNNNILHDTLAVSCVNIITSLLVGIFSFATIGNIAFEQGARIEDVITDGPGLIFIVYPQALARMPAPQMWSVLFFFMLLCLGLNSQFAIVEVVVTSIQDGFPNWIRKKLVYHELLVLILCGVAFFFGLPNIIQGGIYFFQLIDHYVATISILFLAFFQIIAISWFYGVNRLTKNIKEMTSKRPSLYFQFCWFIAAPALLVAIFILGLINYKNVTYGKYKYPDWAHAMGWSITASTLISIPIYAVFNIFRSEGESFMDKVKNTLKPNIYECKICNEHHCEHDFPSDSLQELTPMFSTTAIILQAPPHQHSKSSTPQQNQQKPCNSKQNGGTVEFPTTTKNIESDDKKSKN